jgi:hypothetical protein
MSTINIVEEKVEIITIFYNFAIRFSANYYDTQITFLE